MTKFNEHYCKNKVPVVQKKQSSKKNWRKNEATEISRIYSKSSPGGFAS